MKNLKCILLVLFLLDIIKIEAQFTQGNLVVLQAGDGSIPLANTGNPIVLREYNPTGIPTFSTIIPSTGANAMLIRGSSVSEGYISRSADNKCIVFGGYMKALPNTSTLNALAASTISRGVGLVDANGNFMLGATCGVSALASGDIRGATATNSANVWATSSSQGCSYYGTTSTAANIQNAKSNLRAIHIFNNQLYFSSQVTSGTPAVAGIFSVGNGIPTNSSQSVTAIINTGLSSLPGQFFFSPNNSICYVADARSLSNGGGIQKWINSTGTWSLAYTLPTGTSNVGAFGVVANFSGINSIVYATTTEGSNNRLIAIIDNGAGSSATTIATATFPNTIFRGLAFSPTSSTCTPASVSSISHIGSLCANQSLSLTSNVLGSAPLSYTWLGPSLLSNPNASITGLINQNSGTYTLMIANSCGTSAAVSHLTILPQPISNLSNATICTGGSVSLIASAANSYTWSNGIIGNSIIVSPSVSTIYSIVALSSNSCTALFTVAVNINNSPTLNVMSQTICSGQSASLNAIGASTYTWSNGNIGATTIVNPTLTSIYNVTANAAGCPSAIFGSVSVFVNALPSLTLNMASSMCLSQGSITLEAWPAGGNYSGIAINSAIFNPTTIGTYTLVYTYTDSNKCTNAINKSISVMLCNSIENFEKKLSFKFFPNPAKDKLTIETNLILGSKIEIHDRNGRLVESKFLEEEKVEIDISKFNPGLYSIRCSACNRVFLKE